MPQTDSYHQHQHLYPLVRTGTGERNNKAGPWGQVTVPASTQRSLHMMRERLDTVRTLTLERA